jgi:DNA-binding CsgD family transcriptional regulator
VNDALAAAERGYAHVTRTSGAAQMRSLIVDKHVGVLVQAGRLAEAREVARDALGLAADLPGVAHLLGTAIAGRAALGAGHLTEACELLHTASHLFTGDANGFRYRYLIPLATALAMRGLSKDAAAVLADIDREYHRSWRFVEYEWAIAKAWASAAHGAVSEAIKVALSAAETARETGQSAPEVMCLQTAAQFGDGSGGARLGELEAVVEGPRVRAAARFAKSLSGGDALGLQVASEQFEHMGDLVAALDAVALAAAVHRRGDRNGAALTCSARAEELAGRCGGASTTALRKASQRVPLTDREREVVMLIGEGLSTRQIAERLTLSARTVEGHIYRAMAKTGTEDRDQLARILPRG